MSHDPIFSWLKIAPQAWPPDHYTLLGLKPGETDPARIEQQVHARVEWVRCYQLAHPELVTEAMNRLAKAYDCLSNPESKKAYDDQLNPRPAAAPATSPAPAATPAATPVVLQWSPGIAPAPRTTPAGPAAAPWALPLSPRERGRGEGGRETLEARADRTTMGVPGTAAAPAAPPEAAPLATPEAAGSLPLPLPLPADEPVDPALLAARSAPARRGLGTKRALYVRISKTRRLIRAWTQMEKYLGDPDYKLADRSAAIDLVRQLTIVRQQLHDYAPIIGQAGQAGYLVVALARQPLIVQTYQLLAPSQRQAYVRDWEGGLTVLAAYRLFLRDELSSLRRRSPIGRLLRAIRGFANDHPALWVLLLALVPANIALPGLRAFWPLQAVSLASGLGLLFFFQNVAQRQSLDRLRHPHVKAPLK